jgi:hypothetical protein
MSGLVFEIARKIGAPWNSGGRIRRLNFHVAPKFRVNRGTSHEENVTPSAYERGYYTKLHAALRHWIETAFPFTKAYYSNSEIPELPG